MLNIFLMTILCVLTQRGVLGAQDAGLTQKSSVVRPDGIHFNSYNLRNIVKWNAGEGTNNGTVYTVEYAIYGDEEESGKVKWWVVRQCREIPQTECDLTDETHNLDEDYYARVKAVGTDNVSEWAVTAERFKPMSHTTFGPPQVKVVMRENNINIKMKGPMRWKNKHMKKDYSLSKLYPHMTYNVTVYNNKSKQTQYFLSENNSLKLGRCEYATEFCVSAQAFSKSLPIPSNASKWRCVTTPNDPFKDYMLLVILGGIVPSAISLFMLVMTGCLVYHYIFGNKQKLPRSTNMRHIVEPQQTFCPEQPPMIFNINLITTNLTTAESKLSALPALVHQAGEAEQLVPDGAQLIQSKAASEVNPQVQQAVEPGLVSYTAQHMSMGEVSEASLQGWQAAAAQSEGYGIVVRQSSEVTGVQGSDHDEHPDYGVVVKESPEMTRSQGSKRQMVSEVNSYKSQKEETWLDMTPQEEPEEAGSTCVDWSPDTGILNIPLLSRLGSERQMDMEMESEHDQANAGPILHSVVLRQDSSEQEDGLTQMENIWGLQVNMQE